jgi:hypothetical protein
MPKVVHLSHPTDDVCQVSIIHKPGEKGKNNDSSNCARYVAHAHGHKLNVRNFLLESKSTFPKHCCVCSRMCTNESGSTPQRPPHRRPVVCMEVALLHELCVSPPKGVGWEIPAVRKRFILCLHKRKKKQISSYWRYLCSIWLAECVSYSLNNQLPCFLKHNVQYKQTNVSHYRDPRFFF